MSTAKDVLSPLFLRFRNADLEHGFQSQEIDGFSHHLPAVIFVLVAMNVTRIVLYSVDGKDDAEIAWSVSLLVASLSLRCLLWLRKAKVWVVMASVVFLYLTCVEWIVSFSTFFGFEVRAIIVSLAVVNVYLGLFLFAWAWGVYCLGLTLGTIYLILRTNLYFDEQDIPSQLFTAVLPAAIVYLQLKSVRLSYHSLQQLSAERDKHLSLLTQSPVSLIVLDLDCVLHLTPAASEILQLQDFPAVHSVLKTCYRKDNAARRMEEEWRDALSPTSGMHDATLEGEYILLRDSSPQTLHISSKLIPWERKRPVLALTLTNITKFAHTQVVDTRTEIAGLFAASCKDFLRPTLLRTAAECKSGGSKPPTQLLAAFYSLYCMDDLHKSLTSAEQKPTVKVINLIPELQKISEISQPLFEKFNLTFSFRVDSLPDSLKIDQIRFRQFLSLLLHAICPSAEASSSLALTISPHKNSKELLCILIWTRSGGREQSALLIVAEKLARRIGSEGLKLETNTVRFSVVAGFAPARRLSDVSLDVPADEELKGSMPPQNQFGLFQR